MSVLDKNISYFPSTSDTRNGVTVNLLQLLQSKKHETIINILRAETDPAIQKQIKERLPCYTVAGIFARRCDEGLLMSSGLAAVDLDSAEDYDLIHLLHELKKIPYIAYAGLSCRGKRLFAIIPFLHPDMYSKHYDRLIKSFEDIGLPMGDTCHKAISQPRYISYNSDDTCFYNHNAKLYHLLPPEKTYYTSQGKISSSDNKALINTENAFKWCESQFKKNHSFVEGGRHNYIIALARYCNIKGIPESDTLYGCISNYNTENFNDLEITKIVKHVYFTQSNSYNSNPFIPTTHKQKKHKKNPSSETASKHSTSKVSKKAISIFPSSSTDEPLILQGSAISNIPSSHLTILPPKYSDSVVREIFDSKGILYTNRPYPFICD